MTIKKSGMKSLSVVLFLFILLLGCTQPALTGPQSVTVNGLKINYILHRQHPNIWKAPAAMHGLNINYILHWQHTNMWKTPDIIYVYVRYGGNMVSSVVCVYEIEIPIRRC